MVFLVVDDHGSDSSVDGMFNFATATSASDENHCFEGSWPMPGVRMTPRKPPAFTATERLKLEYMYRSTLPPGTVSQDLQSFYWVIIYAAFRPTVDEIASAGESTTIGIPGFEHDFFETEFRRLFSASSAIGLVEQRRAAFGAERSGPPGKVGSSEDPTIYAGIGNLAAYLRSKEPAFADWISMIWMLLRECEPLVILSSGEIRSKLVKFVNTNLAKPSAAVGPRTKVIYSDYAKRLDHAQVIAALEFGLEILADEEDVTVEEGSKLAQAPVDMTNGDLRAS